MESNLCLRVSWGGKVQANLFSVGGQQTVLGTGVGESRRGVPRHGRVRQKQLATQLGMSTVWSMGRRRWQEGGIETQDMEKCCLLAHSCVWLPVANSACVLIPPNLTCPGETLLTHELGPPTLVVNHESASYLPIT